MKNTVKKISLLFAVMIMSVVLAVTVSAKEVVENGECGMQGDNVEWVLYDDGELVISGTGKMHNYNGLDDVPGWHDDYVNVVVIKDGVTSVGSYAFCDDPIRDGGCISYIDNISLPNTIIEIGVGAFRGCPIKEINIPLSVERIKTRAFNACDVLENVFIPENVYEIGYEAFSGCEKLVSINVSTDSNYYMSYEGVLYNLEKTILIQYPLGKSRSFIVPNGVLEIADYAFSSGYYDFDDCILEEVVLPNSLQIIGKNAFYNRRELKSIEFSKNVERIEDGAFWGCNNLIDVYYNGSEELWNATYVGMFNEPLQSANINYINEHYHTYTSTVTQEPTCWKDGVLTYTCECGDSYTETIEKKEHEYRPWETKVNPKCTQPGMEWSYCLICDNDFEREIPPTGHDIIEYVMRATTDEMAAYGGDGAYMTTCDVCNEVFKQEFFARPAEYELSTSVYTYNGKVRKPTVTVKDADGKTLVAGQDYDIIYPDSMKLPGKYEVTVLFKGNYLGEKRLTFTIKPKATTGLKAKTQDTKSITLSWSKTTGATGYEVYKYNSQTKKYVKIKTTTSTSYKVTSLNAGTTYKFKVRAYKKVGDSTTIFGTYSSVFSTATKTAKPTLKSATQSSGKVKLTWNNVSGESGYEIYYSTSKNGTYKKMSGVAANKISYTTSKLTAGKTYYFKVRTYKTVGDNKVYSAFSNVKSVKIPVVYYITKTGEKYHVDGCRSLSRSKIQISYSNAVARGYKPCNACIL